MPLYRINDFYSGYRSNPGQFDIRNFEIYSDRNEPIGRVTDTLLDQSGNLQYLVVTLATRKVKQVLLSTQQAQIDPQSCYIYLHGLTLRQAERLPAYHTGAPASVPSQAVQPAYRMRSLEESAPLEAAAPLEGYYAASPPAPMQPPVASPAPVIPAEVPPQPIRAESVRSEAIAPPVPTAVEVTREEVIPLLEERLIVDQKKRKVGEVIVRKEIETEIIEVPVQREKLIVEQVGAEPKQLAEIDLSEEHLPPLARKEPQLPHIPQRDA